MIVLLTLFFAAFIIFSILGGEYIADRTDYKLTGKIIRLTGMITAAFMTGQAVSSWFA